MGIVFSVLLFLIASRLLYLHLLYLYLLFLFKKLVVCISKDSFGFFFFLSEKHSIPDKIPRIYHNDCQQQLLINILVINHESLDRALTMKSFPKSIRASSTVSINIHGHWRRSKTSQKKKKYIKSLIKFKLQNVTNWNKIRKIRNCI